RPRGAARCGEAPRRGRLRGGVLRCPQTGRRGSRRPSHRTPAVARRRRRSKAAARRRSSWHHQPNMTEKIAVIGLGYVGLPVALAFASKFPGTLGFDIHAEKVEELKRGYDRNHEQPKEVLQSTSLLMTSDPHDLAGCTFFVVAVPTPVDENNVPDLSPV